MPDSSCKASKLQLTHDTNLIQVSCKKQDKTAAGPKKEVCLKMKGQMSMRELCTTAKNPSCGTAKHMMFEATRFDIPRLEKELTTAMKPEKRADKLLTKFLLRKGCKD